MIDSHCHIDLDVFNANRTEILKRCIDIGISRILVPGLSVSQFKSLLALSYEYPNLDIALGCHPYFMKGEPCQAVVKQNELALNTLAKKHKDKFIAVGECGLDGNLSLDFDFQKAMLQMQIELAIKYHKPLILHHRQSHNELIRLLKQNEFPHGGIIHAFSGSEQIANTYIEMGFMLGVGGTITYPRAKKTRGSIKTIPLEFIVLETDSPDMPLNGFQGEINTPLQLPLVVKELAILKQISEHEVIEQTTRNYNKVLSL